MTQKDKLARDYFKSGYNCAQSVFLAYAQNYGIDKETALKLSSSFGGGMGMLREVCGAVSAMFMIAGLEFGYTEKNNDIAKARHYELIQNLANEFKKKNKSIICRELLGLEENVSSPVPSERTEQYYKERPCENLIGVAFIILD